MGTDRETRAQGWWDECRRMGLVKCRGTCSPVSLLGTEQGDMRPRVPIPAEASPWPGPHAVPREAVFDIPPGRRLGPGRCVTACRWHSWTNSGTRWPSPTLPSPRYPSR